MTSPGLPPTRASVVCGERLHHLAWADGTLTALDHDDVDGELVLGALGAEAAPCAEIVGAWRRAAADARVLVLASRGPADPLVVPDDPRWPTVVSSRLPQVSISSGGWFAYSPLSGTAAPRRHLGASRHGGEPATDELLIGLLELGGGLPERLVATVIATWADRLATGTAAAATVPALTAALSARAGAAVRQWRHDLRAEVAVTMLPPGSPATVRIVGDEVEFAVPFAWLAEVWVPGLAVLLDRLSLGAALDGPRVVLDTIGPQADRRPVVITLADGPEPN